MEKQLTLDDLKLIKRRLRQGVSKAVIARDLGISRPRLYRVIQLNEWEGLK